MVTDEQVRLLRQKMREGKTQEAAAASSGMCVRTARDWKHGVFPSETREPRHWRTRHDPFDQVWDDVISPLLEADEKGELQAKTVLEQLQDSFPGQYPDGQLRTLQRRIRDWRALHGPDREVYFEQAHPPGREAAFDFTHCNELEVTIAGQAFAHMFYVFKLSFSGWFWVQLAFSETFEAMVGGLQSALWALGAVPEVVRHDNLSAATHELKLSGGRSLTRRFAAVLEHYDLKSTRINPGEAHENGVVEKGNDLFKRDLNQALILRGSRDFDSVELYLKFVDAVVARRISKVQHLLEQEKPYLRPLPAHPVPNYSIYDSSVSRWSTIRLGNRGYSVPSRLIGHQVKVRQYADAVEVYYHEHLVESMPRIRGEAGVRIDYRHIIWSLVRKPGAFARYKYREELFPTIVFRQAYDALKDRFRDRADIEYVRVLHLAASTMQSQVERALLQLLHDGVPFDYAAVKAIAHPERTEVPDIRIGEPDLAAYDQLMGGGQ